MTTKSEEQTTGAAPAAAPTPPGAAAPPATKPYFRVFAFHGGGLDTVMQLGIAHALLLVEGRLGGKRPEDLIAGISAGAINAVAVAEILQAGGESQGENRLAAQVARLLEFLEAYRNAPATVLRGFIPDLYETTHRQALKSVVLPRHFGQERRAREESLATRAGLIRLLNGFLNTRVSVGTIVRFIRLGLGWKASRELRWRERWWKRAGVLTRGWWLIARNLGVLSLPTGRLLIMTAWEATRQLLRGRTAQRETGVEAAAIMFDASAGRRFFGAVGAWLVGFLVLAGGVLVPVLPLVALLAVVALIGLFPLLLLLLLPLVPLGAVLALAGWPFVKRAAPHFAVATEAWLADFPRRLRRCFRFRDLLLAHFSILSDLGDSYALKEALVRHFDPDYFGKFKLDTGLHRALRHRPAPSADPANPGTKHLGIYESCAWRPLQVVPLAANLRTGKIESVPRGAAVVDALMAACAVTPFYRAQAIQTRGMTEPKWFIDGVNVANDPVTEALDYLRHDPALVAKIAAEHGGVRIYSVPLLPIEQDELPGRVETYTRLVDVGLRASQLQRFQDSLLEKRLVETYAHALPPQAVFQVPQPNGGDMAFFLTDIVHLTPARPLDLNTRIPGAATAEERRALMESAVADGCRALIERFLTEEDGPLHTAARDRNNRPEIVVRGADSYLPCRQLFPRKPGYKPGDLGPLPGSAPGADAGPGVPEICRRCAAIRGATSEEDQLPRHVRLPRSLAKAVAAPAPVDNTPESPHPAVAFLFSGGVFRGVFQVGFANAVSELGLVPDIVAGASVGTIIGALIGRVLAPPELAERRVQMQRLAGTFLAIDQFVLTDRFADFVRHFSIRAAGADFSLRDADLVFRRFDSGGSATFASRVRRVVAGIERIFYISPFELRDFTETLRTRDYRSAWSQGKSYIQEWLDRYGVGLELLGPEPLQMLIDGMIFDDQPPARAGFGHFASKKQGGRFQLLGTVTNLTRGKLEILRADNTARLTEGLLASSAFPAVFRPRWSWEIFEEPTTVAQYCDGGVMDNLPLDSVVAYLATPGPGGRPRFPRRPAVPHLILTASLEPEPEDWSAAQLPAGDLAERAGSWPVLKRRAAELRYNGKIDKFADSQIQIRRIIEQRCASEPGFDPQAARLPLNLEVAVVKPQWLCSSFAFHPMLGFRRLDQAASIAHGCAATIQRLATLFAEPARHAWAVPRGVQVDQLAGGGRRRQLTASAQARGVCWHRSGSAQSEPICPFSEAAFHDRIAAADGEEKRRLETLAGELGAIYRACGQPETHQRR